MIDRARTEWLSEILGAQTAASITHTSEPLGEVLRCAVRRIERAAVRFGNDPRPLPGSGQLDDVDVATSHPRLGAGPQVVGYVMGPRPAGGAVHQARKEGVAGNSHMTYYRTHVRPD